MEILIALILASGKIVLDIALGSKALKEVKLLREAVTNRLDNHEERLDKLEKTGA